MVLALDAAARRAGLRLGMPAAKAQALVPGLIMRDADPATDTKALDRLALWALQRYAPIAAADPPDGLIIDVTGAAHLHGGEDAMLKGMVERLAASGIAARAAIADSWGAAYAFARTAPGPLSSSQRETARKLFSTCPSPPCACPKPWWRICPSSASRGSVNSRQNPARRLLCVSVQNFAAVSIRPWVV